MVLLDTDVMVDVMRRYAPAVAWLGSLGSETIGIPGLVAMELLQGCRDRREQRQVEKKGFCLSVRDYCGCGTSSIPHPSQCGGSCL
jgi:predicted nucleic acid-binding protein